MVGAHDHVGRRHEVREPLPLRRNSGFTTKPDVGPQARPSARASRGTTSPAICGAGQRAAQRDHEGGRRGGAARPRSRSSPSGPGRRRRRRSPRSPCRRRPAPPRRAASASTARSVTARRPAARWAASAVAQTRLGHGREAGAEPGELDGRHLDERDVVPERGQADGADRADVPGPEDRDPQTTFSARSAVISSAEKPSSPRISSVCSPGSGACERTDAGRARQRDRRRLHADLAQRRMLHRHRHAGGAGSARSRTSP